MSDVRLFFGSIFYPSGGYEDFKGIFESVASAKEWAVSQNEYLSWAHVVCDDHIVLKGFSDVQEGLEIEDRFVWKWSEKVD